MEDDIRRDSRLRGNFTAAGAKRFEQGIGRKIDLPSPGLSRLGRRQDDFERRFALEERLRPRTEGKPAKIVRAKGVTREQRAAATAYQAIFVGSAIPKTLRR